LYILPVLRVEQVWIGGDRLHYQKTFSQQECRWEGKGFVCLVVPGQGNSKSFPAFNMTKYKSRWTQCRQGHNHQSKKESLRCDDLHLLQKAGKIAGLEIQPKYTLLKAFFYYNEKIRPITYTADFFYLDCKTKKRIIEDTKGIRTPTYLLKKKLLMSKLQNDTRTRFIET